MQAKERESESEKTLPFRRLLVALGAFIFVVTGAGLAFKYFSAGSTSADVDLLNEDLSRFNALVPDGLILHSERKTLSIDFQGGRSSLIDGLTLSKKPTKLVIPYDYSLQISPTKELGFSVAVSDDVIQLFVPPATIKSVNIDWAKVSLVPDFPKDERELLLEGVRDNLTIYISSLISNSLRGREEDTAQIESQIIRLLREKFPALGLLERGGKVEVRWSYDQDFDDAGDKN